MRTASLWLAAAALCCGAFAHSSKHLPLAMGALDPGAPTMSRLVDYPNTGASSNAINTAVEGADTHMEHLVSQQMHASSTWEDIEAALQEMDAYERRVISCDNSDLVMEEPMVDENADESHAPSHYQLSDVPSDCCSSYVRYGGSRMRLLPFVAASLQLVRSAKEGASRMVDLSTILPQQFEGFCQGLETTPLGLQRMRYSLESRMRPRSDASVLESSLADLVDVCVPLKQAFEKVRKREASKRHSHGGSSISDEQSHSVRAILDTDQEDSASDTTGDEQSVLAQLRGSSARSHGDTSHDTEDQGTATIWRTATGKVRRLLCAAHL